MNISTLTLLDSPEKIESLRNLPEGTEKTKLLINALLELNEALIENASLVQSLADGLEKATEALKMIAVPMETIIETQNTLHNRITQTEESLTAIFKWIKVKS